MKLLHKIKSLAQENSTEFIAWRRYLHQNPELSFLEFNTQRFINETLKNIGISDIQEIAGTGLVAQIHGEQSGNQVVALRADIDALPIQETNKTDYSSKNEGVMHACGHDVHTASLLGAAKILFGTKSDWSGTVKLLFQPGEEKLPGGASLMIQDGALQNPSPKSIVGQHVMPFLPVGKVGFKSGMYMAAPDELYITVYGKGGHGGMPHLCVDPVLISAHIIIALQQIVSRINQADNPCVLSIGRVIAEGATNVIPNEVKLSGTLRTMNEVWRKTAKEKIIKLCNGIAESMGGKAEVEILDGYPFLKNDEALTARCQENAREYLGRENVVDLGLWMGGEDFAYYSQVMPACFYRLGTRNEEKNIVSAVHTPTFDIDESALEIGAGLMAWHAVKELEIA
jgi:amidohydrolase